MRRAPLLRAIAGVVLTVLGCTNAGENRITGITTTGAVSGVTRVDANGSRVIDGGDDSLPGVNVRLVLKGRQDTGLVETTQPNGAFSFRSVPVGEYSLRIDTTSFADTLQVVKVDSQSFTVASGGTVTVNILVGRPLLTVRQARALALGHKAFIVGVALNGAATFADSTASLADTSGTIRLTGVRGTFAAGDSLRVLATAGQRAVQPTLDDPVVFALGRGSLPTAAPLTTAGAASAAGGTLDAEFVIVHGALISDTVRTPTSFVLTASDGSASLEVQLDRSADVAFQPANLPADFVPGSKFDVLGVLAPTGAGTWRLRPRSAADLTEIPLPTISIAAARALPAGQTAVVVGVALNSSGTFADTTVFLADTSGAIQLTRLRTAAAAGDSVRVRATTAIRLGEPTLDGGTTTALGRGNIPGAAAVTTTVAATAAGGTRDAQLVIVNGAIISDTTRTPTSFILTVSDSSGPLQVQLDRSADVAFQPANLPADFVPGNKYNMLGVLAPTGAGTWRLRPRSAADLTEIPLPTISIAAARALTAGRTAVVVGVALNSSGTFADTTVFLADTSGAIQLTRLRTAVAAGDSVRVRATAATRNGEPALDGGTTTALGRGNVPTAATLRTAVAATAAGGSRDAQLVIVDGAIISDTTRTPTSFILTVSDSSGPLQVQLDRSADAAFQPANLPADFVPGDKFNLLGVLAPTGTGTWRLRPRSAADLTEIPLPVISIAAARTLLPGQTAVVIGVALNASGTFADTTVFLADTSGAIQLTRLRTAVAAGDSVRVRATTATRNGEPTLDGGTTTALGRGFYPTAATLRTAVAATAAGGTRDAQLVIVNGAIISDTTRTPTSFILTVSDSSGPLQVQLDRSADVAFQPANLPADFVPGNKYNMVGVLAPTGTSTWRLRPRSAADLSEIPLPVISIAAARTLLTGRTAVVVGVALNASGTFSDSTVDLADTSGAIRLTRLRTAVAAGDSVRVRATTAIRLGEPTLDGGTTTALGRGFYPTAATLTTALAATAAGGTRDAQLVVVPNATVSDTATVLGNFRLTVSDGSGNLIVVLDRLAGFTIPSVYLKTNTFDIIGLLAPTGTGTWLLEPRSAADLIKH